MYKSKNIDYPNYQVKFWIPEKYIEILFKSIVPKFITWINSDGTTNIENYINQKNPYKHLNYSSEETYLLSHNINTNTVITNSITHILKDIEEYELQELIQYFIPLTKTKKIKVLEVHTQNEKAVYLEIITYLEYIQKIKNLLIKNKNDNRGDRFGTGFRKSSLQKIVDIKIGKLEDRLDDPHCPTSSQDEIEKLEYSIKLLKKSQDDNYSNLLEYSHIVNGLTGLEIDSLGLNNTEKDSLRQVMSFHNGISCSDAELIRSGIIFINMLFNSQLNDDTEYPESILNITTHFFNDEMSEINKLKNQLTFSKEHIEKQYALKTTLDKVSIFVYSTKESPIDELIDIAFKSMAGLENKFEPHNPSMQDLTDYKIMKNIVTVLKYEFQYVKEDIQVFRYFFILLEKGKIPPPHFVQ